MNKNAQNGQKNLLSINQDMKINFIQDNYIQEIENKEKLNQYLKCY